MQAKIKEIQDILCDKISNKGWLGKMRFFLKSTDFEDLILSLVNEVEEQRRFTPPLRDIFNCFEQTPYDQTNVIFILPEPWTNPLLNDGLALSTCNIKDTAPYYTFIAEIEKQLGCCGVVDGNLIKIARQGVLLLNQSLTAQIQQQGMHKEIWADFFNYFMDVMNRKEDLIWVFFGRNDHFNCIDNPSHVKMIVPLLPESKIQKWDSNNLFIRLNEELKNKQKTEIIW